MTAEIKLPDDDWDNLDFVANELSHNGSNLALTRQQAERLFEGQEFLEVTDRRGGVTLLKRISGGSEFEYFVRGGNRREWYPIEELWALAMIRLFQDTRPKVAYF